MSSALVSIDLDHLIRLRGDARGFSFQPRQPVSSLLSGRHASRLRGRGLAFEELRHYHPGDDVRTIDWRATARLRSPYVRVFNEERERPLLLVVDQRAPMFFGSRRAMKSVAAGELAALTAWRALAGGDKVGGIVFNEEEIVCMKPRRGQNQTMRLLNEIARLNHSLTERKPVTGKLTLNRALESALRLSAHDHLVVVITDLDGADELTSQLVTRLAAHNDVLMVAVYDPLGAELTGHPGMKASDRERTWEIPPDAAFTRAFRDSFEDVIWHWRKLFRQLRIPLFPLSTATPVIDQVREITGNTSRK